MAKRSCFEELETKCTSSDPASEWKGQREITNYGNNPPPAPADLANDLNTLYWRFERENLTPFSYPSTSPTTPLTPLASSHPTPITVCEEELSGLFKKQKMRKEPGPDGVSSSCLQACADQPAPVVTKTFNGSLEKCQVRSMFKFLQSVELFGVRLRCVCVVMPLLPAGRFNCRRVSVCCRGDAAQEAAGSSKEFSTFAGRPYAVMLNLMPCQSNMICKIRKDNSPKTQVVMQSFVCPVCSPHPPR